MDHEEKREYREISPRAKELMKREEGLDVEFKQSIDALDITDIVAFANSPLGGAILVGIKEIQKRSGRQEAEIYGAPVGDRAKMQIVQKVNAIIPQLSVDIIIENAAKKPFYRIEIPSGPYKPYCSTSGVYKIRDDGYSKPLLPTTMLSLLLETQAERFYQRFEKATGVLEDEVLGVRRRAEEELDGLERAVRSLNDKADALLERFRIENPDETRRRAQIEKITAMLRNAGIDDDEIISKVIAPLQASLDE